MPYTFPMIDAARQSERATLRQWVHRAAEQMEAAGLYFGHGTANATDEACWMVSHALDLSPDFDEDLLDVRPGTEDLAALEALKQQRIETRKPLAYLIGEAWFAGLRFKVNAHTLVPRSPLAELIVDGLQPWMDLSRPHRVIDIGTGSGCIAAALAWHWPELQVDATDISDDALVVAAENARRLGVGDRVRLFRSDVYDALDGVRYDLIISNPPYVPDASMRALPDEYVHEPAGALAAGADGLDIVRRLIEGAPAHLQPGGLLVVEVGEAQEAAESLLAETDAIWLEFEHGGHGVFLLDVPAAERLVQAWRADGCNDRDTSAT